MQHAYGVDPAAVRLALVIGIALTVLVYERWHLAGGAAVVAGYLALFLDRPLYVLSTVAVAALVVAIVQRFVAGRVFLYGRRRLAVMVIVGLALQCLLTAVTAQPQADWFTGLHGVGFVIPGLIAQDMERQGIVPTGRIVLLTAGLTFLVLRAALVVRSALPVSWTALAVGTAPLEAYAYDPKWLLGAVVLSVVLSAVLFEVAGLRSGGFVTAAYAALFVAHPGHLAFVAAVGAAVYGVVGRGLLPRLPVFGRTKFALMVITGVLFTGIAEFALRAGALASVVPFAGFGVISPMIGALIANDSERQGLARTLAGAAICTAAVWLAVNIVQRAV